MVLLSTNQSTSAEKNPPNKYKRFFLLALLMLLMMTLLTRLVFGTLFGIEGYFPPNPAIDTFFASGYNEDKFFAIQAGDTQAEVLAQIGEPLERMGYLGVRDSWIYSHDGAFALWDFAWLYRSVEFDAEGKVIGLRAETHYD